jgi:Ca-activated chloride channel family protein
MGHPPTKIAAAIRATRAAIDTLRDGAFFAIVEGTHIGRLVYPAEQRLVAATPGTRSEAKQAVKRLAAAGGTAMGSWLRLVNQLLDPHPEAVRHAILLTDGRNEHETRQELDDVLALCEGIFVCDARGIGDDWLPEELLRIVSTLRGSADAVRNDADLVADFTAMTQEAMGKVVPDLRLLISTTSFAGLRSVRQTYPTENDLTSSGVSINARTTRFSTGSWGNGEGREYHIRLAVDGADHERNEDLLAARVDLAVAQAGNELGELFGDPGKIRVHWTDDLGLSSVLHPKVEHYTGQTELGAAMRAGIEAYGERKLERAAARWGHAVAMAAALGNDEALIRLGRLVDIVGDPARGEVRVRADLVLQDILSVYMGSVMSKRSPDSAPRPDPGAAAGFKRPCPRCRYVSPGAATFCSGCGHEFGKAT